MMKRFGAGKLSSGKSGFGEDVNPMESVSNLADVMLVFACGIMMALVMNWNIDVQNAGEFNKVAVDTSNATEVTDQMTGDDGETTITTEDGYVDVGRVYKDPETGTLYMVTEE